jgi:uncharacterized protein
VRVVVRLTPKAASDKIEGWEKSADGRSYLKARVRAVPEDGKANKALVDLVAKSFGVKKSNVSIVSGSRSRIKQVVIEDPSPNLIKMISAGKGHQSN